MHVFGQTKTSSSYIQATDIAQLVERLSHLNAQSLKLGPQHCINQV